MPPVTNYVDFDHGLREIQGRTDAAGVGVVDMSLLEDRAINAILTEGFLTDGAFQVRPDSPASMDLIVGSGVAKRDLFVVEGNDDGQWPYQVSLLAAEVRVTLDASDASADRVDEVWLVVQDANHDASTNGLARIGYRKGEPGAGAPGPDPAWKAAALLGSAPVPATETEVTSVDDGRVSSNLNQVLRAALDATLGGPGSGLDADTVDGVQAAALAKLTGATFTGLVGFEAGIEGRLADNAVSASAGHASWPLGLSWQRITGGPWPSATAMVATFNFGNDSRTWQLLVDSSATATIFFRRLTGASSWSSWQTLVTAENPGTWEVDNSTEVAGPVSLTTVMANIASVTLPIPSDWGSWKCYAHAEYVANVGATRNGYHDARVVIDGTGQQIKRSYLNTIDIGKSVSGRRAGVATTGSRTVSFQAADDNAYVDLRDVFLYARAVRTS